MFQQQPEPPKTANTFMEKVGWPIITISVGTTLATIIGAILLGKIQVLDFNWLMLVLVLILLVITVSFAWYNIRTRSIYQKKYQEDRKTLLADYLRFQDNWRKYFDNEKGRWDKWAIDFSIANTKEQKEHLEEVKRECMEAIGDVKTALTSLIQNNQTLWNEWTTSHANAHQWEQRSYKDQLEALKDRLEALEREFPGKQLSEKSN